MSNNQNKESFNDNLGNNKSILVIKKLANNHISPKFSTAIARKSISSISEFPFVHSNLIDTEDFGNNIEPLEITEDWSDSEDAAISPVQSIQRQSNTILPSTANISENFSFNFNRTLETSPVTPLQRQLDTSTTNIESTQTSPVTPIPTNIESTQTSPVTPTPTNIESTQTSSVTPTPTNIESIETSSVTQLQRQLDTPTTNIESVENSPVIPIPTNIEAVETSPVTPLQRQINTNLPNLNLADQVLENNPIQSIQRRGEIPFSTINNIPQIPISLNSISSISSLNNNQPLGRVENQNINPSFSSDRPIQRSFDNYAQNIDSNNDYLDNNSQVNSQNLSSNNTEIPALPSSSEPISDLQPLNTLQRLSNDNSLISQNSSSQSNSPSTLIQRASNQPENNTLNALNQFFPQNEDLSSTVEPIITPNTPSSLGNSSPIVQRNSSNIPQTSVNYWANISDLIGESSSRSSYHNSTQNTVENVIQRAYNSNSRETENLSVTQNYGDIIQKLDDKILGNTSAETTNISKADQSSSSDHQQENFELLAREIYILLRNRLMIERERKGSYTSDRLSW